MELFAECELFTPLRCSTRIRNDDKIPTKEDAHSVAVMLYKIIVGLLAGQASGFMAAPMVSTPSLRTAASPVMQYGGGYSQGNQQQGDYGGG